MVVLLFPPNENLFSSPSLCTKFTFDHRPGMADSRNRPTVFAPAVFAPPFSPQPFSPQPEIAPPFSPRRFRPSRFRPSHFRPSRFRPSPKLPNHFAQRTFKTKGPLGKMTFEPKDYISYCPRTYWPGPNWPQPKLAPSQIGLNPAAQR